LDITTDTFNVTTKSIAANAVLSRNISGYIGKFKDPETKTDITADFMTQFGVLENFYLPEFKNIVSKENGLVYADSCEIRLYNEDTVGDSLAPMHLKMYELSKPVSDSKDYYTNFDPVQENYIRNGGLTVEKAYTLADVTSSDKEKKEKAQLTPIEELIAEDFGAEGTVERTAFETGVDAFILGERLKEERKKSGLTQAQLAAKIGTKKSYISRIENGHADVQLSTLFRIFAGLGKRVSLSVF